MFAIRVRRSIRSQMFSPLLTACRDGVMMSGRWKLRCWRCRPDRMMMMLFGDVMTERRWRRLQQPVSVTSLRGSRRRRSITAAVVVAAFVVVVVVVADVFVVVVRRCRQRSKQKVRQHAWISRPRCVAVRLKFTQNIVKFAPRMHDATSCIRERPIPCLSKAGHFYFYDNFVKCEPVFVNFHC